MPSNTVRIVAIGLFRNRDCILTFRGVDPVSGEPFCRPLGGGFEFGETAAEALQREIQDELGVEIETPALLWVIENRFLYAGKPGHEVVFVFDSTFSDNELYSQDELPFAELGGELTTARCIPISAFTSGIQTLVPEPLLALLKTLK